MEQLFDSNSGILYALVQLKKIHSCVQKCLSFLCFAAQFIAQCQILNPLNFSPYTLFTKNRIFSNYNSYHVAITLWTKKSSA